MQALFLTFPLLVPPLIFFGLYNYLNSSGPLFVIWLIELPLVIAYVEKVKPDFLQIRRWGPYLRVPVYILLCASFLIFILLIPENLYHAWLILLSAEKPLGMISFAFAYSSGIVSSIGCAYLILWKNWKQAFINLFLLINMVLLLLYPILPVFLLFLILLILSQNFRLKGTSIPHRLIFISIITIPALLFALIFPVKNEVPRGSAVVDTISWKIRDILASNYPDFPIIMQIPGYGYSYDSYREDGSRPALSGSVILRVKSPPSSVLYLRSDVFYEYSGNNWIPEKPEVLSKPEKIPVLDNFTRLDLIVESDIYTRIPLDEKTQFVGLRGSIYRISSSGAYFPPDGIPLTKGDQIQLFDSTRRRITINPPDHEKNMEQAYLLPDKIKSDLINLAESLKGESNKETLANIKAFLAADYNYTLDTNGSSHLIQDFLFNTKKGYCIHFAGAAALLARCEGIPVRIAEGFLVHVSSEEDYRDFQKLGEIAVTGFSAHMWPEIYIEGRGWVPWEVTPPFIRSGENQLDTGQEYDVATRNQLKNLGFLEQEDSYNKKDRWFQPLIFLNKWYRPFLISLTLAAILGLFIIILSRKSDKNIHRRLNRLVLQKKKKRLVQPPSSSGWTEWFCRISTLYPESDDYIHTLLPLILMFYYGPVSLDSAERSAIVRMTNILLRQR